MTFQLAINMERMDASFAMEDVARHMIDLVQMADRGGFNIVWAAEHQALEVAKLKKYEAIGIDEFAGLPEQKRSQELIVNEVIPALA